MSDAPHAPRSPLARLRGRLGGLLTGEGLRERLVRSSGLTMAAFGGSQVLRIAGNLLLTRLLFPEAFGLMALVQVVLTGLTLLSDSGLHVSILQNRRGDERAFLDTVWTVKVIRGFVLWILACALALPMAAFYDEPLLAQMLPVVGLTAIINGFFPTAVATANRHLRIGRLVGINLGTQAFVILVMALLAWALGTVWALVWGNVLGVLTKCLLYRRFLPDSGNRLHWDGGIARELFHFGKWILLGTSANFLVKNADKLILGAFISAAGLGIYNIGFMMASITFTVCEALKKRVLVPLYRMRPPWKDVANRRKAFLVRRLISAGGVAGTVLMSAVGIPLIEILYDDRYALAGPMVVLMGLSLVPQIVTVGATDLMLAAGDSWRAMHLTLARAAAQTALLLLGASWFGVGGAILGPGLAILLTYPLTAYYMRRYRGWDAWGDLAFMAAGMGVIGPICWQQREALLPLFATSL